MPVVEKICKLKNLTYRMEFGREMDKDYARFAFRVGDKDFASTMQWAETGIEATYIAVTRFILWHNSTTPNTK